jgi:hypothetical protein
MHKGFNMAKKSRTRYVLTHRIRENLKQRGFRLICRKCGGVLKEGELIESKPSKYRAKVQYDGTRVGGRKLYHAECYDGMHMDFGDDDGEGDD